MDANALNMSDNHHQSQNPATLHPPPSSSPSQSITNMTPPRSYPSPGTTTRYVAPLQDFHSDAGSDDQDTITLDSDGEVEAKYDEKGTNAKIPSGKLELYFNIRPNEKPMACYSKNYRRPSSFKDGKYNKDITCYMYNNIHWKGYANNLMWLIGAEGIDKAVGVQKYWISSHSRLVRQQLKETNNQCDCIIIPNYTKEVIALLIELLHNGQVQPLQKEHVSLMWDLMKELRIDFDIKSFYYHEIEKEAQQIKPEPGEEEMIFEEEEGKILEEEKNSEGAAQQPQPPLLDPEVNKTTRSWYDEEITNGRVLKKLKKNSQFFGSYQAVRTWHPENPTKRVIVHNLVGGPRSIRESFPAEPHIRADQIQAERQLEEKRIIEGALAGKEEIITIEEEQNAELTKRKSSLPPVITDAELRYLVHTKQLSLEFIRNAAQTKEKVISLPAPKVGPREPAVVSNSGKFDTSAPGTSSRKDIKIETKSNAHFIPPNYQKRTGIAVIPNNTDPEKTLSTTSQILMPHLEPADAEPKKLNLEEHKESSIKDLPKLDMYGIQKETESLSSPASTPSPPQPVAAVVIPKSKVDIAESKSLQIVKRENNIRLIDDGQQPCSSRSLRMERLNDNPRTYPPSEPLPKKKMKLSKEQETVTEEIQEKHPEKLPQQKPKVQVEITVGSRLKDVPVDVKVDTYIEDHTSQNAFHFRTQSSNLSAESSPQQERMAVGSSAEMTVDQNGGNRGRGRGRPKGSLGRGGRGRGRNESEGMELRGK